MEFVKKVVELDVNDVLPNRFQPRIKFNEESINELSDSIKEHGVIQPIVVRAMGDKYEIIAGERRYKASLLAGKTTIPAVITDLNDKDSAEVALIENVQRKDLTPIEEAISYKKILDMGYLTQEELATKLGKNQSTVANKLRLLNLDEDVQDALLNEKISERHARSLLKLSDFNKQRQLLDRIINERLTVRKTDEEIKKMLEENNEGRQDVRPAFAENPFVVTALDGEKHDVQYVTPQPIVIDDNVLEQLTAASEDELSVDAPAPAPAPVDPVLGINVPSEPITDSQVIQPGFMDINKIEEKAQDINTTEVKPEADLNNLLQTPVTAVPAEEPAPAPAPADELKPAKFFNLPAAEEETKEEVEKPAAASAPADAKLNSDPFNFTFTDAPSVAPESAPATNPAASKIDDLLASLNGGGSPAPVQAPAQPVVEAAPAASVQEVAPVVTAPALEVEPTPVVETPAPAPEVADIKFDAIADPTPAADNMATASESLELPGEPPAPSIPASAEALKLEPEVQAESNPTPTLTATIPASSNVVDAVKDVRTLVNDLESKGFKVNAEELDFEKEYQVIIKISK